MNFISASRSYPNLTQVGPAQQVSEICGSLQDLTSDGLVGARAMFAYPNNFYTAQLKQVVQRCGYVAGRQYGSGISTLSSITSTGMVSTLSVNGGDCNDPQAACHSLPANQYPMVRYHYLSVDNLIAKLRGLQPGQLFVLQVYRLITGKSVDGDCTSTNWKEHWTMGTESMCLNDLETVLRAMPAGVKPVTLLNAEADLGVRGA
jgi:hypothetical protein